MNSRCSIVPRVSFEFFPPKSDVAIKQFDAVYAELSALSPDFMSITWGALGAGQEPSLAIHRHLAERSSIAVAAHLTCWGQTESQLLASIEALQALGIRRFVALRGDVLTQEAGKGSGDHRYSHASELVSLLSRVGVEDIAVAAYPEAHPESASWKDDIHWLKVKVDAGATRAITQFFFEPETFLRFRDRAVAAGIHVPLVPGILPVRDIDQVVRFSALCGATVPASLRQQASGIRDKSESLDFAVEQALGLCRQLEAEGVHDFHVYALNQLEPARSIAVGLGLLPQSQPGDDMAMSFAS